MNWSRFRVGLAAALFLTVPAIAQTGGVKPAVFAVAGKEYSYTFPADYCLPVGEDVDIAAQNAAIDTSNHTPVTLDLCGTNGQDYILIKSPKSSGQMDMTKSQFLAEMAAFLGTDEGQAVAQQGMDEGVDKVDEAIDGEASITSTEISYAGHDADCVYLAGRPVVAAGGRDMQVMVASCLTLVDGRMFSVNVYEFPQKSASAETLKARSRAVAASIRSR